MENWQYYGLFLDKDTRDKLISFIGDSEWDYLFEELSRVYLDHCTLLHQAHFKEDIHKSICIKNWLDYLLKSDNNQTKLLLSHVGYSDKAMAFKVMSYPKDMNVYEICFNKIPHITIGTYKDGKPVDSNSITEWHEIKPIKITVNLKRI